MHARKTTVDARPKTQGIMNQPHRRRVITGSNAFYLTKPKNIIEQCDEAHARVMSSTAHAGFNLNPNQMNKNLMKSREA
jgi:hypothetical protein